MKGFYIYFIITIIIMLNHTEKDWFHVTFF